MEIKIQGQHFNLSTMKSLFWKEQKMLVISDVHLGKISHFRKNGIAVPRDALMDNFTRLDHLIQHNDAHEILFLGDLFHSEFNQEWKFFCTWRSRYHSIRMTNVTGNHDILPCEQYGNAGLAVCNASFLKEPFIFTHQPLVHSFKQYNIAGHVHPVIKVKGMAKQRIKLPCFYFGQHQAILPSFGTFTGGYEIDPSIGDMVFGVTKEEVIAIHLW